MRAGVGSGDAGGQKKDCIISPALLTATTFRLTALRKILCRWNRSKRKWESFGWHVLEVDGHNFEAINDAIGEAQAVFEKPSMIIAHTIPGERH